MITSEWTYMYDAGLDAPPEDSETGYSVPVTGCFPFSKDLSQHDEYFTVVAQLASGDKRAVRWLEYDPSGKYNDNCHGTTFAWIARPMDRTEFALHLEKKRKAREAALNGS